jgi:hypothetical protein
MSPRFSPSESYMSLPDEEAESGFLLHGKLQTMNVKTSNSSLPPLVVKHWREIILLAIVFLETIGLYALASIVRQERLAVSRQSCQCDTIRAHSYGQFLYCELTRFFSVHCFSLFFC